MNERMNNADILKKPASSERGGLICHFGLLHPAAPEVPLPLSSLKALHHQYPAKLKRLARAWPAAERFAAAKAGVVNMADIP